MGLAVSTLRYLYLNSQRLDLEFKIMLITQSKTSLMSSMSDLQNIGSDMDENSPVGKQLKQLFGFRAQLCAVLRSPRGCEPSKARLSLQFWALFPIKMVVR